MSTQTARGHMTLDELQRGARLRLGVGAAIGAAMFIGGVGLVELLRLPDEMTDANPAAAATDDQDDAPAAVAVAARDDQPTADDPGRDDDPGAAPQGAPADDGRDDDLPSRDPILLPEGQEPPPRDDEPAARDDEPDDEPAARDDEPTEDDAPAARDDEPGEDGSGDDGSGEEDAIAAQDSGPPPSGPWWDRCRDRKCTLEFGKHRRIIMREGTLRSDRQTGYRPFKDNDVALRLDRDDNPVIVCHFYGFHSRTKEPTLAYVTVHRSSGEKVEGIIPLRLGSLHLQMNLVE